MRRKPSGPACPLRREPDPPGHATLRTPQDQQAPEGRAQRAEGRGRRKNRLAEPGIADAALVAAYTDAFPPAIFSLVNEGEIAGGVPTIDLTIHFREKLPLAAVGPDDFCFAVFRSRRANAGFIEEDGEIWSRDGVLLAQSRQLAMVL